MKAIVIHAAKDLRIEEREIAPPEPGEVQVNIRTGGICGSDLHYYNHGGFGTITLREPMILGHEVSGQVCAVGEGVSTTKEGDLVAVSPSRPCYACKYCLEGSHNHCLNMRFYGSAMPWPHIQGAFQQQINVDARQCVVANELSSAEAALAEPFSVVLHAAQQAGNLMGKKVLITGCGPIGALSIHAARLAGASEIVVTDLEKNALTFATQAGASRTINMKEEPDALKTYESGKGYFDALFECSGSSIALASAITVMRPGGIIMQLGLGGEMMLPVMQITAKELQLRGSFRFHAEFPLAIELMSSGLVDLKGLVSHTFDIDNAVQAFETATNRSQSMKAQIAFQ